MATATKTKKSAQVSVMTIAQVKTAQFGSLKKYWESLGRRVKVGTNTEMLRGMVFVYLAHQALSGADIEISPEDVQAYNEYLVGLPTAFIQQAIGYADPIPTSDPESEKCVLLAGKTHPIAPETTDSTEVVQPANTTPSKPEPTRSKAPGAKGKGKQAIVNEPKPEKCDFAASETPNLEQEAIGKDGQGNQVILVRPNLEQLEAENAKFAAMKVSAPEPKKKAEKPVDVVLAEPKPASEIKPLQPGSKRITWMQMMLEGTTIDAIAKFGGWNMDTARGCPNIAKSYGYGVRRFTDAFGVTRYQLILPAGMTELLVKQPTEKAEKPEKTPAKPRSKAAQIQQFFVKEIIEYDAWADN